MPIDSISLNFAENAKSSKADSPKHETHGKLFKHRMMAMETESIEKKKAKKAREKKKHNDSDDYDENDKGMRFAFVCFFLVACLFLFACKSLFK
jgi:hypothetical protein